MKHLKTAVLHIRDSCSTFNYIYSQDVRLTLIRLTNNTWCQISVKPWLLQLAQMRDCQLEA